jgi:hypothetical protein
MNAADLDRLWQRAARRIVSIDMTGAHDPLPADLPNTTVRAIATLDDGARIELVSFGAHEPPCPTDQFVGLTVDEARRLMGAR